MSQKTGDLDITIELSGKPVGRAQISFSSGCENADAATFVRGGAGAVEGGHADTTITENGCASGAHHANTGLEAGSLRAVSFALHPTPQFPSKRP